MRVVATFSNGDIVKFEHMTQEQFVFLIKDRAVMQSIDGAFYNMAQVTTFEIEYDV